MDALQYLRGCEVHSTVILSSVDSDTLSKLGINVTCEPERETRNLFQQIKHGAAPGRTHGIPQHSLYIY